MTATEILALILGSNAVIESIKYIFNRNSIKAAEEKTHKESNQISLESEIRTSEFYKKEWQELIQRYNAIEEQLESKIKEYMGCRTEIAILQKQYEELLRQITFLKTQINPS